MAQEPLNSQSSFLPNFCAGRSTLAIVLIAELVATIIAIARQSLSRDFWTDLAGISMFLLWIALGSAFILCRASSWLTKQSVAVASTAAITIVVLLIALVSEVVFQLGMYLSGGMPQAIEPFPIDHLQFLTRNIGIGLIVGALALRYFHVSAERKRTIELAAEARINALQARIRPHFLFNSMNTIASLTRSNPEQAERAVEDLADLFRANLSDARKNIRISEEFEIARVYARIEGLRLGDRLRVNWNVEAIPSDALVPSLLLQPLVENAIYHGIERIPDGGEVLVAGRFDANKIEIVVDNPIIEDDNKRNSDERVGHQLALDNIRQRLELAWPGEAGLSVERLPGRYRIALNFPYRQREE